MTKSNIKRGVSLYSYQEEMYTGTLTVESAIAASASFGANGIEVIPEQTFDSFPHLTDDEVSTWFEMHERFGTSPTAYDMFIDTVRRPDRLMTADEGVESVIRDLRLAQRLGTDVMRVIMNTPVEIFKAAAPYAEEYGVRLALEVHGPVHYRHRYLQPYLDVIHQLDSPYVGLMPDMGTFVETFPRIVSERALRDGATPKIVRYILDVYNDHSQTDLQTLTAEVLWKGGNAVDIGLATLATQFCWVPPADLLPHLSHSFHIQAKFYEMVDDHHEYSIPYDQIVPVLVKGGFTGYLSSEYEGNRHIQDVETVDSVEQVRRQHAMFASLLGEDAVEEADRV